MQGAFKNKETLLFIFHLRQKTNQIQISNGKCVTDVWRLNDIFLNKGINKLT